MRQYSVKKKLRGQTFLLFSFFFFLFHFLMMLSCRENAPRHMSFELIVRIPQSKVSLTSENLSLCYNIIPVGLMTVTQLRTILSCFVFFLPAWWKQVCFDSLSHISNMALWYRHQVFVLEKPSGTLLINEFTERFYEFVFIPSTFVWKYGRSIN